MGWERDGVRASCVLSCAPFSNHAATAFAEALQQFVAPERLAHRFVRSVGGIELDRGPGGTGLRSQHCLRLLVRGEQGVKAGAQTSIPAALAVEPRRAFGGGFRKREGEQGFFVRGGGMELVGLAL